MKHTVLCSLLWTVFITAPVLAQSNWVDGYLERYRPSHATAPEGASSTLVQFTQSGELPISMNDIVNFILDKNLDVRSNRLTPRSSYFQSLVLRQIGRAHV